MNKDLLRLARLLLITLALGGGLTDLQAESRPAPGTAVKLTRQYMGLLLKVRNVKYIRTCSCFEKTGELVIDFKDIGPGLRDGALMDCIAVRLKSANDVSVVEEIYDNPLRLDGVLIHFTDRDPIPDKGGITVHN